MRSDLERWSQISPAGVKSAYLILFPRREANIFSGACAVKLSVCYIILSATLPLSVYLFLFLESLSFPRETANRPQFDSGRCTVRSPSFSSGGRVVLIAGFLEASLHCLDSHRRLSQYLRFPQPQRRILGATETKSLNFAYRCDSPVAVAARAPPASVVIV